MGLHANLLDTLTDLQTDHYIKLYARFNVRSYENIPLLFDGKTYGANKDTFDYHASIADYIKSLIIYNVQSDITISETLKQYLRLTGTDDEISVAELRASLPELQVDSLITLRALYTELEVLEMYTNTVSINMNSSILYAKFYCDLSVIKNHMQPVTLLYDNAVNDLRYYGTDQYGIIINLLKNFDGNVDIASLEDFYSYVAPMYPQLYQIINTLFTNYTETVMKRKPPYFAFAEIMSNMHLISSPLSDFTSVLANTVTDIDSDLEDPTKWNFKLASWFLGTSSWIKNSVDNLIATMSASGYVTYIGMLMPIAKAPLKVVGSIIKDNVSNIINLAHINKANTFLHSYLNSYDLNLIIQKNKLLKLQPCNNKNAISTAVEDDTYMGYLLDDLHQIFY